MQTRLFILFILIIILNSYTSAQTAIAKLKFEDAETAYNMGNYNLSLVKLLEAEKLFGKANPPILHLRILCADKLFNTNMRRGYVDSLKKAMNFFLTTYADAEGLEEKYKQVYRISEKYNEILTDEKGFEDFLAKENAKKIKAQELEDMQNPATVYILRKTGYVASGVGFYVFVDSENRCKLNTGKYMQVSLRKGKHVFNIQPNGKELKEKTKDFELDIQAGKIYYLNVVYNSWSGKTSFELLDSEEGKSLFQKLTQDTCN